MRCNMRSAVSFSSPSYVPSVYGFIRIICTNRYLSLKHLCLSTENFSIQERWDRDSTINYNKKNGTGTDRGTAIRSHYWINPRMDCQKQREELFPVVVLRGHDIYCGAAPRIVDETPRTKGRREAEGRGNETMFLLCRIDTKGSEALSALRQVAP